MNESKSIFQSKTAIGNVLAAALIPLLTAYGIQLSAEEIGIVFAAANILFRLISSDPVHLWKK